MRVVVCEKPSVARDLARVLGARGQRKGYLEGDGLRITWCFGHLLELQDPAHYDEAWKRWSLDTLPMVPERFQVRVRKGAEEQFGIVRGLLRDRGTAEVVNACDAGREGELIFRLVYEHAGCEAPVQRLWVSSLTDGAIRNAWSSLQPGARFDALGDAARSRSEADWVVGLNATRAMTCMARAAGGDALWSVGRVQTPTLAMIVTRDAEIEAFVPETYWTVKGSVEAEAGRFDARWTRVLAGKESKGDGEGEAPKGERLRSAEEAEAIVAASVGQPGIVAKADRRTRQERPPLLYDLTALQRRANQRYGLSAGRTLEIAQALYEKHKVLSYPRTDARFLTSDQVAELPAVLDGVGRLDVYAPHVALARNQVGNPGKRVVDDAEVGDHHAIIPTGRTPDSGRLSPDEKRIYDMVARRFLAALSPPAEVALADIVVEVEGKGGVVLPDGVVNPLTWRAKGRVVVAAGWRAVDPPKARKDVELPLVQVGDEVTLASADAKERQTRPPRPHDDASLLDAMEKAGRQLEDADLKRAMRSAGLGTPATRAAVLQTLLDRDYVLREKKALRATAKGKALLEALPSNDLTSPELTGRWEKRLADMAEGKESRGDFMRDVATRAADIVGQIAGIEVPEAARVRTRPEAKPLGDCPVCGKPVRQRGTIYTCDTGRSCPFVVFGTMSKRKISARMVKQVLTQGRSDLVKGFKSRAGKPFDAGLEVGEDGKVGFYFPERRDSGQARSGKKPAAPPARRGPEGRPCPTCGEGRILKGRAAYGCSRWREGCGWRLSFEREGRALGLDEILAQIDGDAASGTAR